MLKFGITAMGIAVMPEATVTWIGVNSRKRADQEYKDNDRIVHIAKKYGGEFGGVKPGTGRD